MSYFVMLWQMLAVAKVLSKQERNFISYFLSNFITTEAILFLINVYSNVSGGEATLRPPE